MIEGSCLCGSVRWRFDGQPDGATACNCTACRRYGTLWAYDYVDEGIHVSGTTQAYVRGRALEFHFCPTCGCVTHWVPRDRSRQGRGINARLLPPDRLAAARIRHRDGAGSGEYLD